MNIQEQLDKKKEELKQTVEEINNLQQTLNTKNQEALRLDGAVRMLSELIKEEQESKKER